MKMDEALEWAADYATRNKLFEPTGVNSRGYADGFKIPTPAEKASIITELARTVVRSQETDWMQTVMARIAQAQKLNTVDDIKDDLANLYDDVLNFRIEYRKD